MITLDQIAHWRRLSDCDALAGAPLGDALKEACDELERMREELGQLRLDDETEQRATALSPSDFDEPF